MRKVLKKIYRIIFSRPQASLTLNIEEGYDFNKSNPLGGGGERVDIQLQNGTVDFNQLDIYQKNHFRRYEFARDVIRSGSICGDFACGTGYGSVMLSEKASKVVGADLNKEVIEVITGRYADKFPNVVFQNINILDIDFDMCFDTIVSFETIEHFEEKDINQLLKVFHKSLKPNGSIIFSTPYMQERSEAAIKLGFHLTFYINEEKIEQWLFEAGFSVEMYKYQNYETHFIENNLAKKDFIICVARKS